MICTKLARARVSPNKRDHWADIAAYAGIAFECMEEGADGSP